MSICLLKSQPKELQCRIVNKKATNIKICLRKYLFNVLNVIGFIPPAAMRRIECGQPLREVVLNVKKLQFET